MPHPRHPPRGRRAGVGRFARIADLRIPGGTTTTMSRNRLIPFILFLGLAQGCTRERPASQEQDQTGMVMSGSPLQEALHRGLEPPGDLEEELRGMGTYE